MRSSYPEGVETDGIGSPSPTKLATTQAEARKEHQIADAAGDVGASNTPFTPEELKVLAPKLKEVEAYIESRQPLESGQKQQLQSRFQYLLGAAKRGVGRIDWLNIFMGQIMQLVTDGIIQHSIHNRRL